MNYLNLIVPNNFNLITKYDSKNNQIYESLSFATMALPCFNFYKDSSHP